MEQTKLGKYMVLFPNGREYHFLKREIFNQEIYHFKSTKDSPLIIDIGSHIGISVLYFKSIFPNSRILAFEPNPYSFEILKENISINGLENIELINMAVSNQEGESKLYIDDSGKGWESNSSLIEGSWNMKEKTKAITIQCTKLEKYLDGIECIDMLKIDTEGTELNILKSSNNILKRCDNISVEYHPKQKNLKKILNILNEYFVLEIYYEGKLLKNPIEGKLLTIQGKKRK